MKILFAVSVMLLSTSCGGSLRESVTWKAKGWAGEAGEPNAGVSCASFDTDGDGYVSCTVFLKSGPTPVECSAWWEGCRMQKPGIMDRRR